MPFMGTAGLDFLPPETTKNGENYAIYCRSSLSSTSESTTSRFLGIPYFSGDNSHFYDSDIDSEFLVRIIREHSKLYAEIRVFTIILSLKTKCGLSSEKYGDRASCHQCKVLKKLQK